MPSSKHICYCLMLDKSPKLKYLQGDEDLCVIKSFVSALHEIGFVEEAAEINGQYEAHKFEAATKAKAIETTIEIAKRVLPKSFEYKHYGCGEFNCFRDLTRNSVFLGCIETSDGHANHAITLFQDLIFDSNEKVALRLSKGGLNYCSNDGSDDTATFRRFATGYSIRCTVDGHKNKIAQKTIAKKIAKKGMSKKQQLN